MKHAKNRLDRRLQDFRIEIITIKTWGWRIAKGGLNHHNFSINAGVSSQCLSLWLSGRVHPSKKNFGMVEGELDKMGV